jgi:phosphatidylglycerophosphatase A
MDLQKAFLTVGFSGLSPKAPGTVGSFVSLILGLAILEVLPTDTLFLLSMLITVLAIKQIDSYQAKNNIHDPKEIVIDELVGMWLALVISGATITQAILSFIFFRVFDIWKPSIIGRIDEKYNNGLAVMGDDILAGIFGGICSMLVYKIIIFFGLV